MARRLILVLTMLISLCGVGMSVSEKQAGAFVGQDLHVKSDKAITEQPETGKFVLLFDGPISMSLGGRSYEAERGVLWLDSVRSDVRGKARVIYSVKAYLDGKITRDKGRYAKATDILEKEVEGGLVMLFEVTGEVFVTVGEREIGEVGENELFKRGAGYSISKMPAFVVQPEALVPEYVEEGVAAEVVEGVEEEAGAVEELPAEEGEEPVKEPKFLYPVNIAPAGEGETPEIVTDEEMGVGTIMGRFYIWQKQDEKGRILELQADNAVVWYERGEKEGGEELTEGEAQSTLDKENIKVVVFTLPSAFDKVSKFFI